MDRRNHTAPDGKSVWNSLETLIWPAAAAGCLIPIISIFSHTQTWELIKDLFL